MVTPKVPLAERSPAPIIYKINYNLAPALINILTISV